jgi:spore coat polysaccharide biosynthesis protein SpsF
MGSTRLPGKVLAGIEGRPMLEHVVQRARHIAGVSEVVVATTTSPRDEPVVTSCDRIGAPVFRGSENDVLDRYRRACQIFHADAVVRITSDCPLIDPGESGRVVNVFVGQAPDLAANDLIPSYPNGLGTEVMTAAALETAWRESKEPYERQHVAPYIYQHPNRFHLVNVAAPSDYSHLRWTVDTPQDLDFVRAVYARLGRNGIFDWREVLDLLATEPALLELNGDIREKALEEC